MTSKYQIVYDPESEMYEVCTLAGTTCGWYENYIEAAWAVEHMEEGE